tara:strand:- start:2346 stop:2474 length:129 start_codon:yes stop_codon:yes gene_type:complete
MVGATIMFVEMFLLPYYIFKYGFALFIWAVIISLIIKGISSR